MGFSKRLKQMERSVKEKVLASPKRNLRSYWRIVPLIVGMVTILFIVRGLGTDRFGILSLTWLFFCSCERFRLRKPI